MNILASTKYNFEIGGLNKAIPHPVTQGLRAAVINEAVLELELFDEPQDTLDGETLWFDFRFRGYDCKANGEIDKRQKAIGSVRFTRNVNALKFLLELAAALPEGYAKETIKQLLAADLERSVEYERKQLERLLKS